MGIKKCIMNEKTRNLRMSLIWGGEKEDKSIPHLTARFASRFNWLRLLMSGSSSSSSSGTLFLSWVVVVGGGGPPLRSFPREADKEKWRVFVVCGVDVGRRCC